MTALNSSRAPLVEARGVRVVRGGRALLDDVSLTLVRGEILAVLGPNGAGKSTLLAVLAADIAPDAGTVFFEGKPLHGWSLRELARHRSVMLQDTQTMFPFTVREVVDMGRAPWHRTPLESEDGEATAWALEAGDVAHLAQRRMPTLSGGERARTSFARVIAGRTGALFLDEPTAALDVGHQEALLRLAQSRARAGDAVLIVLHDLNIAAAYADRIALLRQGRLEALGAPREVLTAELLSDVYATTLDVFPHPVTGRALVIPRRE